MWKARYPYNFGEQMNEAQQVLHEFQDAHCRLLSDDYKPVNTFSDFYGYFLALTDTGLSVSVIHDEDSPNDIRIKIDQEELFNSPENDKLYVFFNFMNNQMITLLSHFKSMKEKLDSEIIDDSTYEADIKDTMRMYNIPIKDFI